MSNTKASPNRFDGYADAGPDEPIFVLRAKDLSAPFAVEVWAQHRQAAVDRAFKPSGDQQKIDSAREIADAMRRWFLENHRLEALTAEHQALLAERTAKGEQYVAVHEIVAWLRKAATPTARVALQEIEQAVKGIAAARVTPTTT